MGSTVADEDSKTLIRGRLWWDLRQRDLQQPSLGFFIGGSECVRFSDHPNPERCRAPQCGAMCLYAAGEQALRAPARGHNGP